MRADRYRGQAPELLGIVRIDLPEALWWRDEPNHLIVAASLFDLRRINDFEQLMERPVFDSYSLVSPEGDLLVGETPAEGLGDGLNFTRHGVAIQLRSQPAGGWLAVYRIGYASFFRHAQWLLAGLLLVPALVLGGWLGLRWYARSVVHPAHRAHQQLVESDTFSRTLIQTAPVALVVLSQDGRQLVTCNQLAGQWLGGAAEILALTSRWKLLDAQGQVAGGICVQVGGRYLQAAFAATLYAGTEAVLCVFNDITVHCEAEAALASAKRAADAASQAKTLFLASMSHEIRTPLYGVLGTLELLDLTELNERQRAYLRTIQGASGTLMQLISDVLDVSKIEAGQMALAPVVFDLLGSFSASAMAKGLQFYACIDPDVPAQLIGDVARIRQVLANLVSNAVKFTDIGRVVLRLKLLSREDGGPPCSGRLPIPASVSRSNSRNACSRLSTRCPECPMPAARAGPVDLLASRGDDGWHAACRQRSGAGQQLQPGAGSARDRTGGLAATGTLAAGNCSGAFAGARTGRQPERLAGALGLYRARRRVLPRGARPDGAAGSAAGAERDRMLVRAAGLCLADGAEPAGIP
ncbi:hypothetical protein NOX73_00015 [Pseudomonas aeruginosa]|nr:histidine kinase dimerization/phospho-acceptor domain-containing protein [Pseudomonas aeruginosa]MCT9627676.1 hypothetical protein [Pseudomonas aeruginosa]